jgi:CDP-glucose 4,6-dehydratase
MENPLGQRLRELPGPLLLTGHTGFKGTWMTFLLEHLNIPVVGYSLPAEVDSLYDRAERMGDIPEAFADIRDYKAFERFVDLHKPSTIIHMAAQPLVLKSYESPRETFDVNVMGTVNVLDIAFKRDFVKAIIVVTTDKVYRNDNSGRAFVETDPLEGKDPYSASKVGTEAVVSAWRQIAKVSGGPKVVSVRAGNVVGGGDFAENRIIPDLIRGVISRNPVEIRNPESIRPWQHVLDPLSGYILLLESLISKGEVRESTLNFGPNQEKVSVSRIVEIGCLFFPDTLLANLNDFSNKDFVEATVLTLNNSKSLSTLEWQPKWDQEESISKTFEWWMRFLEHEEKPRILCNRDIHNFLEMVTSHPGLLNE